MLHIEKLNQISYTPDGEALAWYDLSVSTAAELPALNSVVFGAKIQAPSRAQIIQADEPTIVTLDEDGTWYPKQSGSSKNSLSMSPTLNKAITDSKDDMIDLTEDDIDRISDELEQAETPVKEQKKAYEESIEEPEKEGEDDDELL